MSKTLQYRAIRQKLPMIMSRWAFLVHHLGLYQKLRRLLGERLLLFPLLDNLQVGDLQRALAAARKDLDFANAQVASSNVALASRAKELSVLQIALDDSRAKLSEARVRRRKLCEKCFGCRPLCFFSDHLSCACRRNWIPGVRCPPIVRCLHQEGLIALGPWTGPWQRLCSTKTKSRL